MVNLIVVCEGQTEEAFVNGVLAQTLAEDHVFATPRTIRTSANSRGGALNLERVKHHLRNTLRERDDTYVTTFFDLYGLDSTFRGVAETKGRPPAERADTIQRLLHEDVVEFVECRHERFLPHVQPHEFEALLFSDVSHLREIEPDWAVHEQALMQVSRAVENPEWINDSPETAPSMRLRALKPKFRKVTHGPIAAAKIGLDKIREKCPHFRQWFERIAALRPL